MVLIKTDYCVRCDTVWTSPGKCRCSFNKELYMNKVEMLKEDKQLYDMAWNAAIEAAAEKCEKRRLIGMKEIAAEIRKLKK